MKSRSLLAKVIFCIVLIPSIRACEDSINIGHKHKQELVNKFLKFFERYYYGRPLVWWLPEKSSNFLDKGLYILRETQHTPIVNWTKVGHKAYSYFNKSLKIPSYYLDIYHKNEEGVYILQGRSLFDQPCPVLHFAKELCMCLQNKNVMHFSTFKMAALFVHPAIRALYEKMSGYQKRYATQDLQVKHDYYSHLRKFNAQFLDVMIDFIHTRQQEELIPDEDRNACAQALAMYACLKEAHLYSNLLDQVKREGQYLLDTTPLQHFLKSSLLAFLAANSRGTDKKHLSKLQESTYAAQPSITTLINEGRLLISQKEHLYKLSTNKQGNATNSLSKGEEEYPA